MGFAQFRDLGPHAALGQLDQRRAVALAGDQCGHHGPAGGARHDGGVGRRLDTAVLEHLVDPVDLRGLLVDQCLRYRVRSGSSRTGGGWYEAGGQQSVSE